MSRIANNPVGIPSGVEVFLNGRELSVKGSKGSLEMTIDNQVDIKHEDDVLMFSAANNGKKSGALAGTYRSLVNNMVVGVSEGFTKALQLQGVGYRAQAQGKKLNLTLGFSHPIEYEIPDGIEVETPSQTELVVKGIDKQLVGQVSAEIRAFRPPEPYKGKGVRYANEHVKRKEAKKK
jgi:large subunit ribosomal protein L6